MLLTTCGEVAVVIPFTSEADVEYTFFFKVILPGNYTEILKIEVKVVMVLVLDFFFPSL